MLWKDNVDKVREKSTKTRQITPRSRKRETRIYRVAFALDLATLDYAPSGRIGCSIKRAPSLTRLTFGQRIEHGYGLRWLLWRTGRKGGDPPPCVDIVCTWVTGTRGTKRRFQPTYDPVSNERQSTAIVNRASSSALLLPSSSSSSSFSSFSSSLARSTASPSARHYYFQRTCARRASYFQSQSRLKVIAGGNLVRWIPGSSRGGIEWNSEITSSIVRLNTMAVGNLTLDIYFEICGFLSRSFYVDFLKQAWTCVEKYQIWR